MVPAPAAKGAMQGPYNDSKQADELPARDALVERARVRQHPLHAAGMGFRDISLIVITCSMGASHRDGLTPLPGTRMPSRRPPHQPTCVGQNRRFW